MAEKKIFSKVEAQDIPVFESICGAENVLHDPDSLEKYSHDYTEKLQFFPEVVVLPADTAEISQILKHCNSRNIPVTAAGGRTGLSGGMLPVKGGLILSLERLNQILKIDTENFLAIVQPGVITQTLQDAALAIDLCYPVDPASRGSCTLGGNVAENAGGLRAVKYGVTRDYVLALEVVLASGEIIRTGAKSLKNVAGLDLSSLMVGSEGILGIITEITLKLIPAPGNPLLLLAPFPSGAQACEAVTAILQKGFQPSVLEFMEKAAINYAQEYLQEFPFQTEGIEAHLMVEIEQAEAGRLDELAELLETAGAADILLGETAAEQARLWKVRRAIGEATRSRFTVREEDTCVPRAELAKLWKFIKSESARVGYTAFCFGHAGDGNLHVHIPNQDYDEKFWEEEIPASISRIFEKTLSLGGTLSGEHGIGWVQKRYMPLAFSAASLALMQGIKNTFDPKGILNPGKVFPED